MGPFLTGLVRLQAIELDLTQLRRRMKTRQYAVKSQETKIAQHQSEHDALHAQSTQKRKAYDALALQLKTNEQRIEKLRVDLNAAKTNKEYATLLTEINTQKADSAKTEEEALKILAEADGVKEQAEAVQQLVAAERAKLEEIKASSADEIARLQQMVQDLQSKRDAAAQAVAPDTLVLFDRLAEQYDGEALAVVHVTGRAPRQTYSCGGCYMTLNAEHANALASRDELRQCDNCRRILYLDEKQG